ncbi:MAG: cation transporter [Angelakisella sp.]|nr:cation transporter [Angelakisella sp.]
MTEFLIRRFVKDWEHPELGEVRQRYGRLGSVVGIVVNLLLSLGKLITGALSGSVAITADGVNNLSDAGSSVISLASFRLAARPADAGHPFGHARYEYLASMGVAVIILLLGVELARDSVLRIFLPEEAAFSWVTVGMLAASILAKLWLCAFGRSLGRKINSGLMEAAAADSLSDVLATAAVLLSTLLAPVLPFSPDGYMGVLVALFILRSGVEIIRKAIDQLLGEAPDPKLAEEIDRFVRSYQGVLDCHDLMIHSYGPGRCFATIHAEVSAGEDMLASHEVIDTIEREILREKGIRLVIHMDPVAVDDPQLWLYRGVVGDVLGEIGKELSFHDLRMVAGSHRVKLIFDVTAPFAFPGSDGELVEQILEKLAKRDQRLTAAVTVDRV